MTQINGFPRKSTATVHRSRRDAWSRRRRSPESIERRDWARSAVAALASLVVLGARRQPAGGGETPAASPRRYGMVIDLDRCTGCNACAVACKAEHGVRLGAFRSWVSQKETGEYPRVTRRFLPRLCNHCEDPPCLKVCPTGATRRREDGIVRVDKERCIGCRHCMGACPYNARYFNPDDDPTSAVRFPSRTPGTVDKCDLCEHRVDNGVVPACVNTCPAHARVFGDLNNPSSEMRDILSGRPAVTLLTDFATRPSVLYVGGDPSLFEGG